MLRCQICTRNILKLWLRMSGAWQGRCHKHRRFGAYSRQRRRHLPLYYHLHLYTLQRFHEVSLVRCFTRTFCEVDEERLNKAFIQTKAWSSVQSYFPKLDMVIPVIFVTRKKTEWQQNQFLKSQTNWSQINEGKPTSRVTKSKFVSRTTEAKRNSKEEASASHKRYYQVRYLHKK